MRDRNIRKTSLFLIFLSPIFLSNTPEAAWSFASNSVAAYPQLLDWISRQTGKGADWKSPIFRPHSSA
jgi:hypothetical protein